MKADTEAAGQVESPGGWLSAVGEALMLGIGIGGFFVFPALLAIGAVLSFAGILAPLGDSWVLIALWSAALATAAGLLFSALVMLLEIQWRTAPLPPHEAPAMRGRMTAAEQRSLWMYPLAYGGGAYLALQFGGGVAVVVVIAFAWIGILQANTAHLMRWIRENQERLDVHEAIAAEPWGKFLEDFQQRQARLLGDGDFDAGPDLAWDAREAFIQLCVKHGADKRRVVQALDAAWERHKPEHAPDRS